MNQQNHIVKGMSLIKSKGIASVRPGFDTQTMWSPSEFDGPQGCRPTETCSTSL